MIEQTPRPIPQAIRPLPAPAEGVPGEGANVHHLSPSAVQQVELTQRHSRRVRALRLLLPAVALALIALIVAWPQIKPPGFSISIGSTGDGTADAPHMMNARFTGVDVEGRPFSVTAQSIIQIGETPETVDLTTPQADITLQDGSWLTLNAKSGVFSQKNQILGLRESVNLFHDKGYEFHTSAADIDLRASSASGGRPIAGQGPFGQITAEGFMILDRGRRVVFTGHTRLVILPRNTGHAP